MDIEQHPDARWRRYSALQRTRSAVFPLPQLPTAGGLDSRRRIRPIRDPDHRGRLLIARIIQPHPDCRLCVGIVELLGLLFGGAGSLVQSDVGRILAYGTVSQFGLMFMAIGIGSWSRRIIHFARTRSSNRCWSYA